MFATPKSQIQIKKGDSSEIVPISNDKLGLGNVKASLSSLEGKRSVISRQRLQTSRTLPPRMLKGASQLSLTSKQRIRARPQEYSCSPVASFQEITRLISLNDEQKQFITQLQNEIKTLKIVNARQEKGLQSIDRDSDEFPRLFKSMNEELRVARMDRQRAMEKVAILEKQALSRAAEFHRQQIKIKELKEKLKKHANPDFEALQKELSEKNEELEMCQTKYEEVNRQLKALQAERNREITFAKQKNTKLAKELEEAKAETIRLSNTLKEKERTVNTLSIYSRRSNMSESEDEATNITHKSAKSKKAIREKLYHIVEVAPIVPVSLASSFLKSGNQSATLKLQKGNIPVVGEPEEFDPIQTQDTLHHRVASYPSSNVASRMMTAQKQGSGPGVGAVAGSTAEGNHQRGATFPFDNDMSRSQTPSKPATPRGKTAQSATQDNSKFSFFKPNLKTKSASSAISDGGYSDDFHKDDDSRKE